MLILFVCVEVIVACAKFSAKTSIRFWRSFFRDQGMLLEILDIYGGWYFPNMLLWLRKVRIKNEHGVKRRRMGMIYFLHQESYIVGLILIGGWL